MLRELSNVDRWLTALENHRLESEHRDALVRATRCCPEAGRR